MARLSKLFMPGEREFYDLFEEAAANIVKAAAMLEEMLESWPEKAELAREILLAEQEGDRITHDIIHKLNATFVAKHRKGGSPVYLTTKRLRLTKRKAAAPSPSPP